MHLLLSRLRSSSYNRVLGISRSYTRIMSSAFDIKQSRVLQSRPLSNDDAKWVALRAIDWKDASGKARVWESADRRTRAGDVDGTLS